MGGNWRMPTSDEITELNDKCTGQWTTLNGVNGYKVTGPNGNSIFLPAAGIIDGDGKKYIGAIGSYWTCSLNRDAEYQAFNLQFGENENNTRNSGSFAIIFGCTVRPVSE